MPTEPDRKTGAECSKFGAGRKLCITPNNPIYVLILIAKYITMHNRCLIATQANFPEKESYR